MNKTILSFYCDDTNPYCAPPEAFKIFLDFVVSEGISGEASVILGYEWPEYGLITRPTSDIQSTYLEQVRRAYSCGIDSQFELMTHGGLFDFGDYCIRENVMHEGLWLFEPVVTVVEYEAYFNGILSEGERAGVRFTGLTQPGCGCETCVRRHQELNSGNQSDPNPNVWKALLNLAKGKNSAAERCLVSSAARSNRELPAAWPTMVLMARITCLRTWRIASESG